MLRRTISAAAKKSNPVQIARDQLAHEVRSRAQKIAAAVSATAHIMTVFRMVTPEETGGEDADVGVQLLADIRDLFERLAGPGASFPGQLRSYQVVGYLEAMEERPWPEWKSGKAMTVSQLAEALKPFGVRPKQLRFGPGTQRGYEWESFRDLFSRYFPDPEHMEHPEQAEHQQAATADREGDEMT